MFRQWTLAALIVTTALTVVSAQAKKAPAAAKTVTYDLTITADGNPYTGTMDLATTGGKVTGNMHITKPTEITGKAAGTSKAGVMALEFPYTMVERKCEGKIAMNITMPAKPGPAKGTATIAGCGRSDAEKLAGTVELKPVAAAKK